MTSATGRTITAINLAGALAQAPDARVVLVEVDLRHPAVARALGMPAGRGLSSYLLDASMAPDAVISRPANVAFPAVTVCENTTLNPLICQGNRTRGVPAAVMS